MSKIDTINFDNGLTLYLYEDKRRHSTFFDFVTLFGGLDKDFILNGKEYHMHDGIAHILEHYLCECSDSGNFLEELGKKQMNTNASTGYDMTSYYFNAVEDVEYGIKTILNGIYNVSFTQEKLDRLKTPIVQEIRGRSDNKFYHSNIMSINNLFNNLSFRTIGGTVDEVQNTTIDEVEACYKAFYQPSNQMIFIAGNFNKDEVIKTIKDFYNDLKLQNNSFEKIYIDEDIKVRKKEDTLYFSTPLDYEEINFKIDYSKYSPLEKLNYTFFWNTFFSQYFGMASPLYKELIDKKVITSRINIQHNEYNDIFVLSIGAYTHDIDYFRDRVLSVINDLDCFNEEMFNLDKNTSFMDYILRDDSVMSTIMPFIDNVVSLKYPYMDDIKDLELLKFDDFKKAIKKIDFSNYSITTIKDKEKKS